MKNWQLFAILIVLMLLLCSCSSTETEELPKTIRSTDNKVSVSVPQSWSVYEVELKDNLVLALQDVESGAFAQIFWYPNVEGKEFTSKDYAGEAKNHYGDNVMGNAAKVELESGDKGYYFAYQKAQPDTGGNIFQGYEFFIDFAGGVAEIDIFYQYTDTAPDNDALLMLQDVAKTIRVRA